uniref:Uncharacterized protein n=1 Tax=Scleropages formosus TaxID=113540 RepID=A0A8C9SCQ1_SCLFO
MGIWWIVFDKRSVLLAFYFFLVKRLIMLRRCREHRKASRCKNKQSSFITHTDHKKCVYVLVCVRL